MPENSNYECPFFLGTGHFQIGKLILEIFPFDFIPNNTNSSPIFMKSVNNGLNRFLCF